MLKNCLAFLLIDNKFTDGRIKASLLLPLIQNLRLALAFSNRTLG